MKYDHDIRWMRRIVWLLVATNLIWIGRSLYLHDWAAAATVTLCALNCRAWLGTLKVHQKTRDMSRVTDAVLNGMLESREH